MERAHVRFYAVLVLFIVWVIGLGIMAFTSADKPRAARSEKSLPSSE